MYTCIYMDLYSIPLHSQREHARPRRLLASLATAPRLASLLPAQISLEPRVDNLVPARHACDMATGVLVDGAQD